jgi:hypothetical protein
MLSTHTPPADTTNNKMATYSTIPAAEEPLVAKPQGKSLKALVAGAAVASFALGALAATAVSSSVAAPTTSFFQPMYVFNQQLGTTDFETCKKECPTISGNAFKKGEMHIPCITSFDMNHQLLAWMTKKYGPVKTFAWIGHRNDKWVEKACEDFQNDQYKGDMAKRNGCAFKGDLSKPKCEGSEFDGAPGCAVLVNAETDTGAAALNLPSGPITSYEQLHGNWIKSKDCEYADVEFDGGDKKTVNCICQKIV